MQAGVRPAVGDSLAELRMAYSGINAGIQHQDMAMIETMGPLSDRSKEHLGGSDLGIIEWRARLIAAVRDFQAGDEPPALSPPVDYAAVRAISTVVRHGGDWRAVTWNHRSGQPTTGAGLEGAAAVS
jgi:hypothetical protein